jgi:hypothetical protein
MSYDAVANRTVVQDSSGGITTSTYRSFAATKENSGMFLAMAA